MRQGNRSADACPQGVYQTAGDDNWIAVSVEDDAQWDRLRNLINGDHWIRSPSLDTAAGRREQHDRLDVALAAWVRPQNADSLADHLATLGIPAAKVLDPADVASNVQLRSRGFVEAFDHPLLGTHEVISMPFRLASYCGPWIQSASPMLGQHNAEIIVGLLGKTSVFLDQLRTKGVIGESPVG
jgi:crotonobetainyl-CoA:carnitine CoA-transferase CaiB-like acyl-CoA transferase